MQGVISSCRSPRLTLIFPHPRGQSESQQRGHLFAENMSACDAVEPIKAHHLEWKNAVQTQDSLPYLNFPRSDMVRPNQNVALSELAFFYISMSAEGKCRLI